MRKTLLTALAFVLTAFCAIAQPRPEYPRPQFERDTWQNLNGEWTYELDPVKTGHERELFRSEGFDGKTLSLLLLKVNFPE